MSRVSKDELEYCSKHSACYDCHSDGKVVASVKAQARGSLKVPCCRKHFHAYKNKINEAGARKYARSSALKREAGECAYKGCHHKLILRELVPSWWKRESTCGMHGVFKAFRVNRAALVSYVLQHCLSPGAEEGMAAQNIIYNVGEGYILFGLSKPNLYLTKGFAASDLLERCEQFRGLKSRSFE